MRYLQVIFLSVVLAVTGTAQETEVDTFPNQGYLARIAECRRQVAQAFVTDDRGEVQFWMDSLQRLSGMQYIGLYWDERWLLYLWLGNYAPVFEEVVHYPDIVLLEDRSVPPLKDSLFDVVDRKLYVEHAALFTQMNRALLSAEERAFGTLLIEYLLRLNATPEAQADFDARVDAFLRHYPNSRFRGFASRRMYHVPKVSNWGFGFDGLFFSGNWSRGLYRSLSPPLGADIAFFVHYKRWATGLRFNVAQVSLRRSIVHEGFEWFGGDPAQFSSTELEVGYILYRKGRLQWGPVVAVGRSGIEPPDDEEGEFPGYYFDVFRFDGWHYTASVEIDLALGGHTKSFEDSYVGLRLRLGHRWLDLSEGNPAFRGNVFFISTGVLISLRPPRY